MKTKILIEAEMMMRFIKRLWLTIDFASPPPCLRLLPDYAIDLINGGLIYRLSR